MPSKQKSKSRSRRRRKARKPSGGPSRSRRPSCSDQKTGAGRRSDKPTAADKRLLLVLAEHGAIPIDLLASFGRRSIAEMQQWVERGEELKWLRSTVYPIEEHEWILPRIRGAKLGGMQYVRRERPSVTQLDHRRKIIEARLLLRKEKPGWRWISEREFRNPRERQWVPDGVLTRGSQRWVIEVEMSKKDIAGVARRLEALLTEYTAVLYFCSNGNREMLEQLKRSGRFRGLQIRPLPGETFKRRRGPYRPSSDAQRVLQLISEEGMVPEVHLAPLLGWSRSRVAEALEHLEEQNCVCRALDVHGESGWVSCTERGSVRSRTGLPHFHIPGRRALRKRLILMGIRLDLEARHPTPSWMTRRLLVREQGSRTGVPHAAIQIGRKRYAVHLLDQRPVRGLLVKHLKSLSKGYDGILCYRTGNVPLWMSNPAALSKRYDLAEVELRDLPKLDESAGGSGLDDDRRAGAGRGRQLAAVRLLLEKEKPGWTWVGHRGPAGGGVAAPGAVLKRGDKRYAIEVELSGKDVQTLREELTEWCDAYDRVIFFCSLPAFRRVQRFIRSGDFPNLEARLAPGAMSFRSCPPVIRASYEPSPEAREMLRLINEEGLVGVAQLHRALGWTVEKAAETLVELIENGCIRHGLEVNGDQGWVWCNYRGAWRSQTDLGPIRVPGRGSLRKRFALMEVRLDALARWPEAKWKTRRQMRRDYSLPSSGVPVAVIERGGLRYAVMVLESRCYWKPTLELLKQWKGEYAGVVIYRTSRLIPWMKAFVEEHELSHVEVRDLPKPPADSPYSTLEDEGRCGYEPFEPTEQEQRLLRLASLEGLISMLQLPRILGCDAAEAERLVTSLQERNCLQRHFEEDWPGGWIMLNGRGTTLSGTGLARAKAPKSDCLEQRFQLMEVRLSRSEPLSLEDWKTRRELAKGLVSHAPVAHAAMRVGGKWSAVVLYFREFRRTETTAALERWSSEFDGVTCFCREQDVDTLKRFVARHGLSSVKVMAIPLAPDEPARGRQEAFDAALRLEQEEREARDHPKVMARRAVAAAIRGGRLVKPKVCQNGCHIEKPDDLDAHHKDYKVPLDIEWLCITCHIAADAALEEQRPMQVA